MLELIGISKSYKDRRVLSIDSLRIDKGETVLLAGENGSGKSTLLKIIAGVVKSDEGQCNKSGRVLYLPQQCIGFDMSCLDNLLFGHKKTKELRDRALSLLTTAGLIELKDNNAKKLSGGEKQKLALCRLMMNSCELLLLDEPTSALDVVGTETVYNMITDYKARTGCTLLISLHSPALAKQIKGRMILLSNGRIIEDGNTEELFLSPSSKEGRAFFSQWTIR